MAEVVLPVSASVAVNVRSNAKSPKLTGLFNRSDHRCSCNHSSSLSPLSAPFFSQPNGAQLMSRNLLKSDVRHSCSTAPAARICDSLTGRWP